LTFDDPFGVILCSSTPDNLAVRVDDKWKFHTGDSPGICFASPGAIPIEMAHSSATILIDVEIALRARGCVRATTRVDLELISGINLVVLNVTFGNFRIFVIYTDIVVKIRLLGR
jgi:hypothetical protein